MADSACTEPGCRAGPGSVRHSHHCRDLNATGETCWTCKVADWLIWFGGALPTMIRCARCGKGFNISARLQATTKPAARGME